MPRVCSFTHALEIVPFKQDGLNRSRNPNPDSDKDLSYYLSFLCFQFSAPNDSPVVHRYQYCNSFFRHIILFEVPKCVKRFLSFPWKLRELSSYFRD